MAVQLPSLTPLSFIDPLYRNLLLKAPQSLSTPQVLFTIVKDISGTASRLPFSLQYNTSNQYGSTASLIAEPRGFTNVLTYSTVTQILESTQPPQFTGATFYTSSLFLSNTTSFPLQANTVLLQTFSTQLLTAISSLFTSPHISSLIFYGSPSSITFSNETLYAGQTPIAPYVASDFVIQYIHTTPSWTPASLPGLQTWFDARDLSTMYVDEAMTRTISTGEQFAVWLDKSSNLFSCVQTVASNQPFYTDLSGVLFSTTTIMSTNFYAYSTMTFSMLTTPQLFGPYYGDHYFINADTWINYIAPTYTTISGPTFWSIYFLNNSNFAKMVYLNQNVNVPGRSPDIDTKAPFDNELPNYGITYPEQFDHYTIFYERVSTNTVITRQNGHNNGLVTANDYVSNYQWWHMGDSRPPADTWLGGPYGWRGDVIVYDRILNESEMQMLEGYLMWKYGIQSNLLPQHPYAKASP